MWKGKVLRNNKVLVKCSQIDAPDDLCACSWLKLINKFVRDLIDWIGAKKKERRVQIVSFGRNQML